ncbi:DUF3427 domain-containing protein [Falseniella ignava]|uniref:DUF3427 domain-containing protein n=1 Tax=Falseniella ignava TaxID=137730 RepID=A0A2I1K4F4_9LACT|nr:DEAD/DEAH box helicase [Falseniella ignava]PKY90524.1 DUF3427 domain-containing protein [Falseniella ignava]
MTNFEQRLMSSLGHSLVDPQHYTQYSYAPQLIINRHEEGRHVITSIQELLMEANEFAFNIAFVTQAGLGMIKTQLADFALRGGHGKILVSPYLSFNHPATLRELLKFPQVEVKIANSNLNHHAKSYWFNLNGYQVLITGSSNLTDSALKTNYEWNVSLTSTHNGQFIQEAMTEFRAVWDQASHIDEHYIQKYEQLRQPQIFSIKNRLGTGKSSDLDKTNQALPLELINDPLTPYYPVSIKPNAMQQEALKGLDSIRHSGAHRSLVISATGTGKTYLAAFDVKQYQPRRMLFIVHREQILNQALDDFQRVLGFSAGQAAIYRSNQPVDSHVQYLFATIQSLSREDNLQSFSPDDFDYILIDEAHRAGAPSYLRVIDHFKPDFLLGMTATPDRTDDYNLYELFDYNIAYEIRLREALEAEMLSPFLYYGVTEIMSDGKLLDEFTHFNQLTSDERVRHIIEKIDYYSFEGHPSRGLIFVGSVEEARTLSNKLNQYGLKTTYLSGKDPQPVRQRAIEQLESGQLEYILTVDIFNEGIDIPSINQVIMLRQTASSIIFTQQLGRGLRKHPSKEFVTVIDFIGNYQNNYLIPIALFGDRSSNKDNYRRQMSDLNQIQGLTSVNFEQIAKNQIFASITQAKLSSIQHLRKNYLTLEERLGRTPWMIDYLTQQQMDPAVFFENPTFKTYADVINKFSNYDHITLDPQYHALLDFMTRELLNGKRPHELIILREIFSRNGTIYESELQTVFKKEGVTWNDALRQSVHRILDLSFYTQSEQKRYQGPVVIYRKGQYQLDSRLTNLFNDTAALNVANDIIQTGLYQSKQYPAGYQGQLDIGMKYSRKDACRLLNWNTDESSTVYGYKTKHGTCPIFVTYHKNEDISDSTMYEDQFRNQQIFQWYTRSRRTLASKEVQQLYHSQATGLQIHLFVKKEDAEGSDFYYLGPVQTHPESFCETKIPANNQLLDIVTMDLILETPVKYDLYHYLTHTLHT